MPAISLFSIESSLSQFNKRDHTQNHGGDDSDVRSPAVMIGLVIAALTLFVAAVPLFRCPRFHRWVSSFSVPSSVKKAFGIVTLKNPPPTTATAKDEEDLSDNPVDITAPDLALIPNNHSNAFPYRHNVTPQEGGRVPQVEGLVGLKRPQPALTWPLS